MCGILGCMTTSGVERARSAVRRMIRESRHRGPDGQGELIISLSGDAGHLAFGHTRLSIIDLSERSDQPIHDADSDSWLIFNGEIYNFRELKSELKNLGHAFSSSGDAEVLLKALVQWGEGALNRLMGMFAFAFWDGRKSELLLARDCIGIKPLYYLAEPNLLIFASEVRGIEASGLRHLSVAADAVHSMLTYGAVIGPTTIFNEVKELIPGHFLRVSDNGRNICEREYWSIARDAFLSLRQSHSVSEAVAQVKQSLAESVKSHLVSDVPIGIFLSGGVDSSILAILAAQQTKSELTLMTVGFSEQEFSEVQEASRIAHFAKLRHETIYLRPEMLQEFLPDALAAIDQPTVDGINTFVISKVGASRGLRVLLSGLGGDELFGGYTTFHKAPLLYRCRPLLRGVARLMMSFDPPNSVQFDKILRASPIHSIIDAYLMQRSIQWKESAKLALKNGDTILSKDFRDDVAQLNSDFHKIAALELAFYMRNQLLRDADVFSMANSVELRVPFLDLRVLQAALSLPGRFHIGIGGGKKISRRILAELTEGAYQSHPKRGFVFPWKIWLRGVLKARISDTLLNRDCYATLGLDAQHGVELVDAFNRDDSLVSWSELWSLFILLDWHGKRSRCPVAAV
jgi:asparagine synthase (glutamine-hydrolysing)